MAAPTKNEILGFGQLIKPFQRNKRGKTIEKDLKPAHTINTNESGIGDKIHNAEDDGLPEYPSEKKYVTEDIIPKIIKYDIDKSKKKSCCYLWVLNEQGIKILWEGVENLQDVEDYSVKHTNISGGDTAFHGGELFVHENKKIYINNKSDRYGDSETEQWNAVIVYFKKVYVDYEIIDLENYEI
jgi:hypothetical protein